MLAGAVPAGWKGVPNRSKPMQRHVRAQRPSQVDTQERWMKKVRWKQGEEDRTAVCTCTYIYLHTPVYSYSGFREGAVLKTLNIVGSI